MVDVIASKNMNEYQKRKGRHDAQECLLLESEVNKCYQYRHSKHDTIKEQTEGKTISQGKEDLQKQNCTCSRLPLSKIGDGVCIPI